MLTVENIIHTQYSDHDIVCAPVETNVGKICVYSLNLLIRKALTLRQVHHEDKIMVRLNCPLSWLLNSPVMTEILVMLEKYGKKLQPVQASFSGGKEQLELIDISSGAISNVLPPVSKYYLETEEVFYARMNFLGRLVGEMMMNAITEGELCFFSIQELQSDDKTFSSFINGITADERNHLNCFCLKKGEAYLPAILFDDRQFECVNLEENIEFCTRIEEFKQEFSSLIRKDNSSEFIGQLIIGAFRNIATNHVILVSSFHADFLMMNQACHETSSLMENIADLAQKHGIIIAGDFNRKIQNISEINLLEQNIQQEYYGAAFKSTEAGLQLHDTIDAIFVPKVFPQLKPFLGCKT